jgi:hypothetical protein
LTISFLEENCSGEEKDELTKAGLRIHSFSLSPYANEEQLNKI